MSVPPPSVAADREEDGQALGTQADGESVEGGPTGATRRGFLLALPFLHRHRSLPRLLFCL
eukprot:12415367-Prorocentrum_lima.AAC.1